MTTDTPTKPPAERIDMLDPQFSEETKDRHMRRYSWAVRKISDRFVRAGRVVDFACGTGYGSAMLLQVSHTVLGCDKDEVSLDIARKRHGGTLLNFMFANGPIPGHFPVDAVVSIETIEHLERPDLFLKDAFDLIDWEGLLILSTPEGRLDRVVTNPFHLREYTRQELRDEVAKAGFVDIRYDDWLPGFLCLTARRPK